MVYEGIVNGQRNGWRGKWMIFDEGILGITPFSCNFLF